MDREDLKVIDGENREPQAPAQAFDVINDGKALRVSTHVVHKAVYARKQLEEMRAQKTEELRQIVALLAKMNELGIE